MLLLLFLIVLLLYICIRIFVSRKSESLACLVGKTALVTGGNSGLGYATSFLLASRGCRVIIADRNNSDKTVEEIKRITGNQQITYMSLDLSSLKLTREFAKELKKTETKIDIFINNAGIGNSDKLKTNDDLNTVMHINYFGAFLLTHLLLDLLRAAESPRVIFMGSISIFFNNLTMKNLNYIKHDKTTWRKDLYSNSKLCDVLAAQEFSKKLKRFNIMVNSVDPGIVDTNLFPSSYAISPSWLYEVLTYITLKIIGTKAFGGAQTIFDVATNPKLASQTGKHYSYLMQWFKPSILGSQKFCDDVWKKSEELVKLSPEERIPN
ncbi:dehydrogenase/reductase SDR family member 13-like [Harmonia axyridis]|uniref:dehydrogenase/reductase SDR family member 13-like n=1 Tax=Harmonia axyridis TaxID=115357 RepID=UPI001E275DB9|nr:dehydrogenase/reductase SDR family member 13-like [Harmonia axyridis]